MKRVLGIASIALVAIVSATSFAQEDHSHHAAHNMEMMQGEAAQAYEAANANMHKSMAIEYSGNADVDFARGMIPHHQGAIEMAKVVLKYGKDPEIRKLAEDIIAAQEKEIAWMEGWLKTQAQ